MGRETRQNRVREQRTPGEFWSGEVVLEGEGEKTAPPVKMSKEAGISTGGVFFPDFPRRFCQTPLPKIKALSEPKRVVHTGWVVVCWGSFVVSAWMSSAYHLYFLLLGGGFVLGF